jgi:hypothetical protein
VGTETDASEIAIAEKIKKRLATLKEELDINGIIYTAGKKLNGVILPEVLEVITDGVGRNNDRTQIRGLSILDRVKYQETDWEYYDGDIGQREMTGRIPGWYQEVDFWGIELKACKRAEEAGIVAGSGNELLLRTGINGAWQESQGPWNGQTYLYRRIFSYDAMRIGFNFEERNN